MGEEESGRGGFCCPYTKYREEAREGGEMLLLSLSLFLFMAIWHHFIREMLQTKDGGCGKFVLVKIQTALKVMLSCLLHITVPRLRNDLFLSARHHRKNIISIYYRGRTIGGHLPSSPPP